MNNFKEQVIKKYDEKFDIDYNIVWEDGYYDIKNFILSTIDSLLDEIEAGLPKKRKVPFFTKHPEADIDARGFNDCLKQVKDLVESYNKFEG